MVHLGHIDGDEFTILLDQPFGSVLGKTGRFAEILNGVGVFMVPPGIDDNDIALLDSGSGRFKVFCRNGFITFFRQIKDNTIAEKAVDGFSVPDHWKVLTAIALGYMGDIDSLPADLAAIENGPKKRKEFATFVFSEKFGNPAE